MDPENAEQINTRKENKSSIGSIISIIVIIAVIVLGGLYFWGKRLEESKANENLITTFTGPGTKKNRIIIQNNNGIIQKRHTIYMAQVSHLQH